MKILVTGGYGFIGSALIRHIIKNTNYSVLNIDNLTYASNINSLNEINSSERYLFKKGSINNKSFIRKFLKSFQPDIIMNLAAETHVDRSIKNSDKFILTNILGVHNLLKESLKYFEKLKSSKKNKFKFIQISTDEVFGDLDLKQKKKFYEKSPYNPSSPYSASKASGDLLVQSWSRTYGLPVIVTNCSNNYGPYQNNEKLIPTIIRCALKKKKIPIYGDGLNTRDWLYVEDHANALLTIAMSGKIGENYLIGANSEYKNIEIVNKICHILDTIKPLKSNNLKSYKDLIYFIKDRPGHDRRYSVNCSKLKKEMGWRPSVNFDKGLKKTINWYLNKF